jgi:uncharacterized membrane protein
MTDLCSALQLLSVAVWGLFAGAQLAEGCLLVPYWQSLKPAEFHAWYVANDRRLVAFFGPLTAAIVLVSVALAGAATLSAHPVRGIAVLCAGIGLAILAGFFAYFKDANARFAAGTIPVAELPAELARWARWHWVRTFLALVAFAAVLASL